MLRTEDVLLKYGLSRGFSASDSAPGCEVDHGVVGETGPVMEEGLGFVPQRISGCGGGGPFCTS